MRSEDYLLENSDRHRSRESSSRQSQLMGNELNVTNARLNYMARYIVRLRTEFDALKQTVSTMQASLTAATTQPTRMTPTQVPKVLNRSRSIGFQFPEVQETPPPTEYSYSSVFSDASSMVSFDASEVSSEASSEGPTTSKRKLKGKTKQKSPIRTLTLNTTQPQTKRRKRRSCVVPSALRLQSKKANSVRSSIYASSDTHPRLQAHR